MGLLGRDLADSFGVLMFEMFCGQLPFLSTKAIDLVHCHIAVRPPQPEVV
jgi:serine/threonine protein kinase